MNLKAIGITFALCCIPGLSGDVTEIATSFSTDYFAAKYISYLVVFGCWNHWEKMAFFRRDILQTIRFAYIPIRENLEMQRILKVNYYKIGVMLDLDCPRSDIILDQFTENGIPYNESYFWLMISAADSVPVDLLSELPLSVATEITVALRHQQSYVLYDVYNFSHRHGGRLNVTYMGYWTAHEGLRNELSQYKYKRRQNFHRLTLNFSTHTTHQPIPDLKTYITSSTNRHLDALIRHNYALLQQLVDFYNITVNLIKADTWGYFVNGTWNGIIAQMLHGLVDIAIPPFLFKAERLDVCDYTVQGYAAKMAFVFRHPKTNDAHNVFLMPFKEDVWWTILATAVFYWLLLYITVQIELYYANYPKSSAMDTNSGSETALIITAALCQQGVSAGPRIYSGRIVFLSLFLWGLLLLQFYSASVVGSLLSQPPRFINTLKDLSDSNIDCGLENMAYNRDYLATTTDPIVREFYRKKVQVNEKRKEEPYLTAKEGMLKVQKGGYAFHIGTSAAYRIIKSTFSEDAICELAEIPLMSDIKPVSTVVSKHSPFKKMVTYGLRKVMESGTPTRLQLIWYCTRPQCPESYSSRPVPVALKTFRPALITLFMGIALSIFLMLIEMYLYRRKLRKITSINDQLSESLRISVFSNFEFSKMHRVQWSDDLK